MKKFIILLLISISFNSYSQNIEFDNNIKKMLEIQGIEKNWEMIINKMIEMQKEYHPDIENEYWVRFREKMLEDSYSKLYELVVPIYKKHLTNDEVKAIIEFYETEAGKSLLLKTPIILEESMKAGGELGVVIASQIIDEIESEKSEKFEVTNTDCNLFKVGKFKNYLPDSSTIVIERDDKHQTEYYNGTTTKFKIRWLNECKYSLTMIKSDNVIIEKTKGQVLITNIYETGANYYKFISTFEGMDIKLDGVVYKIE